ncbi:ABC transporter ATP-binding protein [Clostridium estertheticum]|uniref:ABC transporter ATP-binding protein n=1 Tax=Clostridium estertheticum TaxID=238834 RepID=UPI0013E98DC4|nr:ABC transporter ATP-binding protein [Clostridium estertheticum]MBZ9688704.1 ABC transporter ATP-binding protein [Clostridium estertheticum]
MIKVEINNISMNYHSLTAETPALKDISFGVQEGHFLSIVGPSGCGKSTLLNIIAGLITPSKGEIVIKSFDDTSSFSKIGYMFQKDQLFDWLTIWDNVLLGLKINHCITEDKMDMVKNLLTNYNLWEFRNHHPKELSGGMRQRVALIRTLALRPEVLLLDEPFSALDYQTRLNISDEVYEIIKKEKKTTIMVTHDISEAISMSDEIIILSSRPAVVIKNIPLKFEENFSLPLKRREAPSFRVYFNEIWKEMNRNADSKR